MKSTVAGRETIYLVDGSGYIFRAFFAIQQLSTRDGFPTNALYGFFRMLMKLLSQSDSQHVVMVFDAGRETFRNELYPEYKANRDECPPDLVPQMPYFRDIAESLGLPILEHAGYEADDVIATLTKRFEQAGYETVIVSADKDLMQLVSGTVRIWDSMRDRWFGRAEVMEKFGVPPERVVEVLALTGDTSDNVPGLKGVGPKTAAQLVEKFGDVATILSSVDEIREDKSIRNRKKIADQIEFEGETVRLSRRLVEVCTEVPLVLAHGDGPLTLSELSDAELLRVMERGELDRSKLLSLVEQFEFTTLANEFRSQLPQRRAEAEYITIYEDGFPDWAEEFLRQEEFAFDLETTSLDPNDAEVVGIAVCWSSERAFYVPIGHREAPAGKSQISLERFFESCGQAFLDGRRKLIGQNLKFDLSVLAARGYRVPSISFDSRIAAYLLNPDRGTYSLTALTQDYLGVSPIEYADVAKGMGDFSEVSIAAATEYAGEDAQLAWRLREKLEPQLEEQGLMPVFRQIEIPLVPVLAEMERTGVLLDCKLLAEMSEEFAARMQQVKSDVFEIAGGEFNINSPKQLAIVLFEKLGIPTRGIKKTKTGFSTDSSVLEKLSTDYPLPNLLLRYRMLHKLKSTYIDALPAQLSTRTGRLHSRFNQTVTATGRLSSSEPNLQNIPIQTTEGRRIRKAFVAPEGSVLLSADYSQIELRLLAHLSGDERLLEAFRSDEDIHAATARDILDLFRDEPVTPEQRRIGKTINFGIIYGMSAFRLSRDLGIPVAEAGSYIDNYFRRYAGVREYFDNVEQRAEREGYVETLFGRKRFMAQIDASGRDRGFVRRAALNAPIQGSAADLIKLAMIRISGEIRSRKLPVRLLLQIHDELVFECPEPQHEEVGEFIRKQMETVIDLSVPLKVELGVGKNWEEAH